MSAFRRASKSFSRLRLALIGPSGSGKSYTSLALGVELAAQLGTGRVAVIDTERGSASKYADLFSFDVMELTQFDPRLYIDAIKAAENERYDVIVIDSLSHAWTGRGGALDQVDQAAKRSKSNNTFTAWRDVTPLHNALVDAMLGSSCHIIATMRTKVEYVMEADQHTGKNTPKKIGMAPIQREGMDYEFDITGDVDLDHNLVITKTRCKALDREVVNKPGKAFAQILVNWLTDGAPAPVVQDGRAASHAPVAMPAAPPAAPPVAPHSLGSLSADYADRVRDLVHQTGMADHQLRTALARRGVSEIDRLTIADAETLIAGLERILAAQQVSEAAPPVVPVVPVVPVAPPAPPAPMPAEPGTTLTPNVVAGLIGEALSPTLSEHRSSAERQAYALQLSMDLGYSAGNLIGHLRGFGVEHVDQLDSEGLTMFIGHLEESKRLQEATGKPLTFPDENPPIPFLGSDAEDHVIPDTTREEREPGPVKPRAKSKARDKATPETVSH